MMSQYAIGHKAFPGPGRNVCLAPGRPQCRHAGVQRTAPRCRARVVRVQANAKVDGILAKAKAKYQEGDRLQAMKLYEDALNEEPTLQQRQAALYGCTAVHAAFGDIELAQITLREALIQGLDYEKAIEDPANVEIVASQQVIIQLRRFAQQVRNAMENRPAVSRPYVRRTGAVQDIDSIVGSIGSDQAEVDTSIPGIIKRVALVLAVGIALGVGLFFLGLEYLFPKGI